MGPARLDNGYHQASHHEEPRLRVVLRLLAEGSVLVVVLAFGWWGIASLGSDTPASESDSLAAMGEQIYVAGCPVADTLEEGSAQGGAGKKGGYCSEEGVSHPVNSRQPGAGLGEHAHRAER